LKRSPILTSLDKESYEWLEAQNPDLLTEIENAVAGGAKPDAVYRLVLQYLGADRQALAIRIRQAANFIKRTAERG
jgi:hypothetical protein